MDGSSYVRIWTARQIPLRFFELAQCNVETGFMERLLCALHGVLKISVAPHNNALSRQELPTGSKINKNIIYLLGKFDNITVTVGCFDKSN